MSHNFTVDELLRELPPLYSNDEKSPEETLVPVKLFNPCGAGTWWLTEASRCCPGHSNYDCADPECGPKESWDEVLAFGMCHITDAELGYVNMDELMGLKLMGGMGIERDIHWNPKTTLAKVMEMVK